MSKPSQTSLLIYHLLMLLPLNAPEWAYFLIYLSSATLIFACVFPNWPIFCSISHRWSNCFLVKNFLQSCWYALITKNSISKSPLQPARILRSTASLISPSLPIIEPRYRKDSLSHKSYITLHIPTKVAIHIFCLFMTYFQSLRF